MSQDKPESEKDVFLEIQRFQATGLIGLRTATAAALAAAGQPLVGIFKDPQSALTAHLKALVGARTRIPAEEARELADKLQLSMNRLMLELVLVAQSYARAPVSNFHVGAVARGKSGDLLMGFNLEFPNQALTQTVHGEQSLIASAMLHGESGFEAIAFSESPSGQSRQVLNEVAGAGDVEVLLPGRAVTHLKELLPEFFGPEDMGVEGALLSSRPHRVELATESEDGLVNLALEAARRSYAPYTHCPSGVVVQTNKGDYQGSYAENAAFNPSLSPLQAALVAVVAAGERYEDIRRVVLVEREANRPDLVCQEGVTRLLLERIAPEASFEVHHVAYVTE